MLGRSELPFFTYKPHPERPATSSSSYRSTSSTKVRAFRWSFTRYARLKADFRLSYVEANIACASFEQDSDCEWAKRKAMAARFTGRRRRLGSNVRAEGIRHQTWPRVQTVGDAWQTSNYSFNYTARYRHSARPVISEPAPLSGLLRAFCSTSTTCPHERARVLRRADEGSGAKR